ncbi:MAG: hypothetical protein ACR2PS_00230 [Pseudomonadales bacterium]
MKDINGRDIKISDKIKRHDPFCFGFITDGNGKRSPAIMPPVEGSQVIDFASSTCVMTHHGVYLARTLEVID